MFSSSLRIIIGQLPAATHLRHSLSISASLSRHMLQLRGGSEDCSRNISSNVAASETKYVTLDFPAPGTRKFVLRYLF